MKWLIITVGWSSQPIVTSIKTWHPDRVAFVCSDNSNENKSSCRQIMGEGLVCSSKDDGKEQNLPNIPTQAGLNEEQYKDYLITVPADDIESAYDRIVKRIADIRAEDKNATITADYTGGTKSMSIALAMAAIDDGNIIDIKFVTGPRQDLPKVTLGESLRPAKVTGIRIRHISKEINLLMKELQYAAAANLLAEFIAEIDVDSSWQKAVNCLQAFDAWNRFDYQYALELFRAVGGEKNEKFLKVLGCLASSDRPAWESRSGYLLARDLLSNAARQAAQCRYEDAAARHYRAVELVAQTQLFMRHKITTASVMYDQIPSDIFWKPEIDNGPLEIGLFRAWELAAALDSKVGDLFNEWRARLKEAIKIRNMSLCAHGTAVITRSDYDNDSSNGMRAFASAAIKLLDSGGPKIPEFPRNLEALT